MVSEKERERNAISFSSFYPLLFHISTDFTEARSSEDREVEHQDESSLAQRSGKRRKFVSTVALNLLAAYEIFIILDMKRCPSLSLSLSLFLSFSLQVRTSA